MQTIDDNKRRKIRFEWSDSHDSRKNNDYFFIDSFSYACIELNVIRAIKSKGDIDIYYGREGWICLLIYYAKVLEELVYNYDEAWFIVPQDVISRISYILNIPLKIQYCMPYHYSTMIDRQILDEVVLVAKYIQQLLKECVELDISNINILMKKLEHGDDKQEDNTTYEDCLEEDD